VDGQDTFPRLLEIPTESRGSAVSGRYEEHRRGTSITDRGSSAGGFRSRLGLQWMPRRPRGPRVTVADDRPQVTSVRPGDCGCRSRGKGGGRGQAREASRDRSREDSVVRPSPPPPPASWLGRLADREIDTRDTKFFTLTGRFSRQLRRRPPRPIFPVRVRAASRSVATRVFGDCTALVACNSPSYLEREHFRRSGEGRPSDQSDRIGIAGLLGIDPWL
jgi:hypothetical protein